MPPNSFCVGINGVAHVTLRGFRIDAKKVADQVWIVGASAGANLEELDFVAEEDTMCVEIFDLHLSTEHPPLRIQNCTMRSPKSASIFVQARGSDFPFNESRSCTNIMICNNDFFNSHDTVVLAGSPERVLVVGNRMVDCFAGIDLREFLPGAENVVVANNTMIRNTRPLRVWDEKNAGLACKNIRFQNNLVLSPMRNADFFFFDHKRGIFNNDETPGDITGLLKAWRFSHNWREISEPKSSDVDAKFWIPGPRDKLQKPIAMESRTRGDANFLRPSRDSELGRTGAGLDDPTLPLPAYVGALPPTGVEAWDWSKTWNALVSRQR